MSRLVRELDVSREEIAGLSTEQAIEMLEQPLARGGSAGRVVAQRLYRNLSGQPKDC